MSLNLFCVENWISIPDVGSVLVKNIEVNWQPTPGPLIVSCFLGDLCPWARPYLLSLARGKSAPVWRDSLCTDCAFDCVICVDLAVDLSGPLLQCCWDLVWVFSSPANRDWHESALRMFYSVSGPLSPSISLSLWGFPIDTAVSLCWTEPRSQ